MSDSTPLVSLQNVGKQYGQRWAVRNINLTIGPGEIVGFIGPNGAGKTTLMRLIAGLSTPSEGQMTVLGERLDGRELHTPTGIGLVLEQMGFVAHLSGRANLEMLAELRQMATANTVKETLIRVGLDPADRRPVRMYSLGMRQRLCLAQALMEKPKLLLLDEPTNGLDPAGIVVLRNLLIDAANQGAAILVCSHLLTEVERICHRVLLVHAGEIIRNIDLRFPGPLRVRVVVSHNKDADALLSSGLSAERQAIESSAPTFLVTPNGSIPELIRHLVAHGIDVEEISPVQPSLEREVLTLFRR
jgi:ABC-type multidrug transport system ATPase subunit